MTTDNRELNAIELDAVSGGMKWTPGTKNPDVIDARGGQLSFLGLTFTFDINGKVSSYGPRP
ncbi:hypothetical protein JQ634_32715 [Bradyrhizobium sp. AUGA SZCCT0240]|uniref:hypothetical protein n=1 Tax=unclassified Bradyrhizobium TaxID=2631580 RepID=UPI001BA81068|nr:MULTISPECIES: hypothetical protein [unclassified Bradyrhizobium]MBR1194301.1 hypothetical protein [Bradyrhizobium sp. AUGA SZCCT0160]MBR1195757.1 hypothetical protein [Bradyrhizobium sp. AUGA SZCCT0158]MBR1243569.1 hypothetical protein [Bradyrhizobium sp. AUGA SZCCT0274]MBR1251851.1 hypothetical protein [Bradyrhizobium sp. AUGA SZCCT0169]MBR1258420.1 hypothetical protein [Bradyrhizobium sp. AUGA SZCCT0240]